jgi:hypothetical protein
MSMVAPGSAVAVTTTGCNGTLPVGPVWLASAVSAAVVVVNRSAATEQSSKAGSDDRVTGKRLSIVLS